MKYFLDTEFIEGKQERPLLLKSRRGNWMIGYPKPTIDLISIGIVAEDGREYYSISKDFNLKEAWNRYQIEEKIEPHSYVTYKNYWIRNNVLKSIWNELVTNCYLKENMTVDEHHSFTYSSLKKLLKLYGKSNKDIAEEIIVFTGERIRNLPGVKTNNLRQFYGYYCDYDWVVFCWLFGKMIDLPEGFPMYCRDLKQVLDEKQAKLEGIKHLKSEPNYPKQDNEHNALDDAKWNFELYKFLNKL